MRVKLDIHERTTPLKWRGGTPHHSLFSPSIYVGHSGAAPCKLQYLSATGHSDTLPPSSSRVREHQPSSHTFLRRSHFSIYGPGVQKKLLGQHDKLDIQILDCTTPILSGFSYRQPVLAQSN
ncbi:hypothetical protein AVEN_196810-1 [Araneus ventricosus]|uniref:Uncharacterized protein n=1 Tax=Araneus ventricosus TaxID=182803 RepID=A0A4Y2JHL5_ARAVE|nr:hypothetical protein AVEN_196810-1 [Araneus ventricosus]